jgi:lipoate-protein ligase A
MKCDWANFRLERLLVWNDIAGRVAPEHMAFDEWMLGQQSPCLRAYRWNHAAVSVGTMASAQAAVSFAGERPWVRRWTGGGIVEHGSDLTIALALPADALTWELDARAVYGWIHRAAEKALRPIISAVRAADAQDFINGPQCFESPVCSDLMLGDAKILGGALRRSRAGILYQGSLQRVLPPDDFLPLMAANLADNCVVWRPDLDAESAAKSLARSRYASDNWKFRRA